MRARASAPAAPTDLRVREPSSRILLGLLGYALRALLVLPLLVPAGFGVAAPTILFDEYERIGPFVGLLTMLALLTFLFARTRSRLGGTLLLRGDWVEVGPRFWPVRVQYGQLERVVCAPIPGTGAARLELVADDVQRAFRLSEADALSCERALRERAAAAGGLRVKTPSGPTLEGGDGQSVTLAPLPANELVPDGIVETSDRLSWPWSVSIGNVMMLGLVLLWDAFSVLWMSKQSEVPFAFVLLTLLQAVVTYTFLAHFVNRTHLAVRDGVLRVRHTGLPWPGYSAREFVARDVAGVYVQTRVVRSQKASATYHELMMVDPHYIQTCLGRAPSAAHARHIEQWLVKVLHLPSGRDDG